MENASAEYDLIIVGAGPGGCACAITAARAGAKVLLLEKDQFPRHKVCGEFVSAESLRLLQWLLGNNPFHSRPAIGSARVFAGRKSISIPIAPAAQSIPRFDLDNALLHAGSDAGVSAREGVTVREVKTGHVFTVVTLKHSFTARAVVNASGRWSQLTQHPVSKKPASKENDKWIGVKAHFREQQPPSSVDLYFFDGGYCGVQAVNENTINACAMVRASAARTLDEVLNLHPALRQRSRDWQPLFPALTTSGLHFRKPQTESDGMMLTGDAAGFIDPFAGDGISLALHGGTLAARALLLFFQDQCSLAQAHERYAREYRRLLAPTFRNAARVRMALAAPPFIRSILLSLAATRPIATALVSSTRAKHSTDCPR
jgi:flavin-dependent dehydrogenase